MSTELTELERDLVLYNDMCQAISKFYEIDQCREVTNKADAMILYYKRIKDEATRRKFAEVRLRAYRQMAKIIGDVDFTGCRNQEDQFKKINDTFPQTPLTKNEFEQLMRLVKIEDQEFQQVLNDYECTGALGNVLDNYRAYREKIRVSKMTKEELAVEEIKAEKAQLANEAAAIKKREEELTQREEDLFHKQIIQDVKEAYQEAGYTLDRRDRLKMKNIVVPLREDLHTILRQAAFDRHMTMSEIFRDAVRKWLVVEGYEFPDKPVKKPVRKEQKESPGQRPHV